MNYEDIKKVIESCHLNFLIGSGSSRLFLGTLGSIEKLLTDLAKSNIPDDDKIIIETSIKNHYWKIAIRGNLEIWNRGNSLLDSTINSYKVFYSSLNSILNKRKTNLISKQVNIFTTNIDLFNENALEEGGFNYNDGFLGRLNPVFGTIINET
ncbi:hypothetical protein OX284_007110 [Flavobacterium sp. SUN046]|uniref:hypothetical protein n=1 Tax=Flavobacterium sp. SUN046 TaxID=3002440 RepID=UPI002DBBD222|nr:hypothetical protein [Flavobacterium sp. SUN046]MEC4049193.1 hypothetical protein [Flavobacterium sp. SUN046]